MRPPLNISTLSHIMSAFETFFAICSAHLVCSTHHQYDERSAGGAKNRAFNIRGCDLLILVVSLEALAELKDGNLLCI